MALLLDTNAVVWWLTDSPRLSGEARAAIDAEVVSGSVYVSAVSGLEMALGEARGVMPSAAAFVDDAEASGFRLLSFDAQDAIAVAGLPRLHGDPFDRALAAQAQRRQLTLMTADRVLAEYPIAVYRL
jgi:PIN domain nuclease of toxin-antitoxin system